MEKLLHNVNELPASARSAVELLVGHPLRDDQQLYIVALDTATEPAREQRRAAADELQKIMEVMHENARRSGISPEEIDRMVDEACDAVRHGG